MPTSRFARLLISLVLGLLFVSSTFGLRIGLAYWSIERDQFDPDSARTRLEAMTESDTAAAQLDLVELEAQMIEDEPVAAAESDGEEATGIQLEPVEDDARFPHLRSPRLPDELFETYLLVGSDLSGALADAIILVMLPEDGSAPILASLPRDLYLPSLCTDSYTRINAALGGCRGVATGSELLSLTVEDFTGVSVDHFARVNFEGFRNVIDTLGGIEICVDHPTRDLKADLYLDAGCTQASGTEALAWVRTRSTQEYSDGRWQSIGASDFTRQDHQQEVLLQLLGRMSEFGSIAALGEVAAQLADFVRLDEAFSIGDAVALAWSYRNLNPDALIKVTLDYENYLTPNGAWVLLPVSSFLDGLAAAYPPLSG